MYHCRVCNETIPSLSNHIAESHADLLQAMSRQEVCKLFRCSKECAGKAFSIAGVRGLEPFACPRCGLRDKSTIGEHILGHHINEIIVAIRSGIRAEDAANWLFAGSLSKGRMTEVMRMVRTMLDDNDDDDSDYPLAVPMTYDYDGNRITFRYPHAGEKCVALLVDAYSLSTWMDRVMEVGER